MSENGKKNTIEGVVFDFGGVMTTCTMPERVRPIVNELGIDWAILEAGFGRYRRLMDGGFITMDEMYENIWADAGVSLAPPVLARIVENDIASFLYPNLRTLAWMKSLKARGFRLGILTNMPPSFAPRFRETFGDFLALSDATVISGEARMYKPQRRIYDLLRERIGLKAESLCFIDDVESNCAGARAAGWQAIRFSDNDQIARDFDAALRA